MKVTITHSGLNAVEKERIRPLVDQAVQIFEFQHRNYAQAGETVQIGDNFIDITKTSGQILVNVVNINPSEQPEEEGYSLAYKVYRDYPTDLTIDYVLCDWQLKPTRYITHDLAKILHVLTTPHTLHMETILTAPGDMRTATTLTCTNSSAILSNGPDIPDKFQFNMNELDWNNVKIGTLRTGYQTYETDQTMVGECSYFGPDNPFNGWARTYGISNTTVGPLENHGYLIWDQFLNSKQRVYFYEQHNVDFLNTVDGGWQMPPFGGESPTYSWSWSHNREYILSVDGAEVVLGILSGTITGYKPYGATYIDGYGPYTDGVQLEDAQITTYEPRTIRPDNYKDDLSQTMGKPAIATYTFVTADADYNLLQAGYGYAYNGKYAMKLYPADHKVLGYQTPLGHPFLYALKLL